MAKSIRSKSKLRAKTVKRKNEFGNFVDGRNQRISDKMADHMKTQREEAILKKKELVAAGELPASDLVKAEEAEEALIAASTEDAIKEEPKKVSTSGWRTSNTQKFKGKKGKKTNKAMKF